MTQNSSAAARPRRFFILSTVLTFAVCIATAGIAHAAPNPKALVSTEWIAENAEKPNVRLIEVSVDPGLYERGHIPGAVNVSWHSDLVDFPRRDVVTKKQFEELAAHLGVTPKTTVVLYGDNNNWFAAWGAWIFKLYGHEDVRLVDGGRRKWEAEKRALAVNTPSFAKTSYTAKAADPKLRARIGEVVAIAEGKNKSALIDIRSNDEYTGKIIAPAGVQELAVRAGHVPNAVNVPWGTAVNQTDGTFKSAAELKAIYAGKGVDGSKPVVVYCRIGERSAHTWFALSQILGYDVKQYDGSWTEYGNAVGVPVNNPAGTVWAGK